MFPNKLITINEDSVNLGILFLFLLIVYVAVYWGMLKYLKEVYQEILKNLESEDRNKIISVVYIVLVKWRLTVVYGAILIFLLVVALNVLKNIFVN
ncbi:hypothetical protein CO051_00575 [Candidatus Roizmanbacteria bacterium CG_4_9_14_0_2_um_filter_39_13]|uniref:Uncharacterized protein n=2 Tax=Candidatus Roizmaniibacteriota TaxID=1752723 RepID=A0A2M8F3Z0_9BACT|nr:MAG: hypothetical protein COY15_00020 [Candidatus Roizmanbacteria bacterium CG_4_10_14_0_2_um_filter_39_12]PJC34009.1 MAG: hypothetical protein CO051_00575 [Candidatus Roizmanbacteria bacterium CG_4_9_14_0_2_um_filter_39_13]PJE62126.1 MAG: hypothetical protein COU87_01030 [Candidatus Roizmanbacteria bacterium CG10_big_fil_rev_8_21_14_0_10_39_12]